MNWISIDTPPTKEGHYLVIYTGILHLEYAIGFYRIEHGHGWDNNNYATFHISAWMPLPEPPK
jgi:hypothetical protein